MTSILGNTMPEWQRNGFFKKSFYKTGILHFIIKRYGRVNHIYAGPGESSPGSSYLISPGIYEFLLCIGLFIKGTKINAFS